MFNLIFRLILLSVFLSPRIILSQSTWIQQNSGTTSSINAVCFINNSTGFCTGDGGLLLKTTNSGLNWNPMPGPANFDFDYIKFFGNDSAVLGANGMDSIYFSTNRGTNWYLRDVNTPYYSYYRQIYFINFNVGYYYSGGHLYKTSNNGLSWTDNYTTIGIKHISFVNELTGWEAGTYTIPYPPPYGTNYAEVRKTTNGGINWSIQLSIQENSYSVYRVFFKDVNTGFYNDFSATSLKRTINGGTNYSSVINGGNYKNYYAMHFSSNETGWFVGDQIIKTTDGGANFSSITNTVFPVNSFKGMFFINDNTGWLVGLSGVILKTQTGGITSINRIGRIVKEYKLEQNFPNPFNPSTYVKFDVPKTAYIRIAVYDINGKEIQTLVNERLHAGTYETSFDGAFMPGGVYFYNLRTETFSQTLKMILLK